MITSRKKRPLDRKITQLRDSKLIIHAVEGNQTEKQYFSIFRKTRIQIKILASADNRSAPEYVLERLISYKDDYQLDDNDELWLMIDVDRWGDKKLSEIARYANQRGYGMAVSNPCFEVWLYLHFSLISGNISNCGRVKQMLKNKIGGYKSGNIPAEKFEPFVEDAVDRAKSIDSKSDEQRWPNKTGTHVYRVVENILALK